MSADGGKCDHGGPDECPNEPAYFCWLEEGAAKKLDIAVPLYICAEHAEECRLNGHKLRRFNKEKRG